MKVLIACECSQEVCKAFRAKGHVAYSCDLQPCYGGKPEWHIQDDALSIMYGDTWDMIIAHPPCTDLATSGALWYTKGRKTEEDKQKAAAFFMEFVNAPCKRIAIENPVGFMSTLYRKPDQIIQPWMFGDNFSKATCLWLKGLPLLIPEVTEKPELEWKEWTDKNGRKRRQQKWYYEAFSKTHNAADRQRIRSKTFPGIARAMAEQWGGENI